MSMFEVACTDVRGRLHALVPHVDVGVKTGRTGVGAYIHDRAPSSIAPPARQSREQDPAARPSPRPPVIAGSRRRAGRLGQRWGDVRSTRRLRLPWVIVRGAQGAKTGILAWRPAVR